MLRAVLFLSTCGIFAGFPGLFAAEVPAVPPAEVARQVDELFEEIWNAQDIVPADLSDNATFLRRVSLDLTGRIPDVRAVREFLNDDRPDKRQRLIQKLLGTTEQSLHLSNVLADAMLPNENEVPQFQIWLNLQLQEGATWDKIASGLIAPSQGNGSGSALFINSLDNKPEKIADATARVFLGLQMGCAECHDHPFGQWTREEFWNYAAFFADLAAGQERIIFGKRIEVIVEEARPAPGQPLTIPDTNTIARPQFPGTKEPIEKNATSDRERLAAWMVAPENPWFARAAVNRMWSMMFGRGLVEPVDDLTVSETSPAKDVLEHLARDFTAHGYDLDRLLEILVSTRVYQLASHMENQSVRPELFHVMSVRSLTAEQIYNCLIRAVSGRRPTASQLRDSGIEAQQFVQSLTAPTQSATEFQAGIPQMLTLLNGPLMARVTDSQKCDLLAALEDSPFFTDEDRIEILYLSTLTRKPTPAEHDRAKKFLADRRKADSQGQELGDLLWVLLNSSEFLLNH